MKAKKHLGQHFLTSKNAVRTMITSAEITSSDVVVEVGPGRGVLTRALLDAGATVTAIETDADMITVLESLFQPELTNGTLQILHTDIREVNLREYIPGPYKVVANIPYYITGEIIRQFLTATHPPKSITILIQKEVAERIAQNTKETVLSLSVKAYGIPRYVCSVPARYFNPAPKVDSAILHIADISRNFFTDLDESHFFKVVKSGFSSKRKKLLNNLASFGSKKELESVFQNSGLPMEVRAENLSIQQWKELATKL